ncbi:hypothetical protein L2E82_50042 [Cichorium intybus]|nr:hypothetical protein L2E82_50042 [Cichorium intybus]
MVDKSNALQVLDKMPQEPDGQQSKYVKNAHIDELGTSKNFGDDGSKNMCQTVTTTTSLDQAFVFEEMLFWFYSLVIMLYGSTTFDRHKWLKM